MFKCYSLVDFPSGTEIPFAKNVTQNEPFEKAIITLYFSISGPTNVKINRPGTEENNGIIRHTGPQNTKYSTLEARLRSFRDWPPALKQEPRQLAEAGFYYIGFSDQTKCFYCDGGLRNWQSEDNPWTEHARWFSKCSFVRLIKGDEFISKCLDERPPEHLTPVVSKNPRQASDEEIKALMSSIIVQQVLRMGVEPSRIKSALKKQILKNGQPFSDPNSLVNAALSESPSISRAESHRSNPRQSLDKEIKALMSSRVVQQVLHLGVEPSRIKSALREQILQNGQPFSNPSSLVSAVLLVSLPFFLPDSLIHLLCYRKNP